MEAIAPSPVVAAVATAARLLGEAIDQFRRGQVALRPLVAVAPGG